MMIAIFFISGSGGRRIILENGNMVIKPVSRDDEGIYSCTAENFYGRDTSFGRLIVLRMFYLLPLLHKM